jgi:hypothetical protein
MAAGKNERRGGLMNLVSEKQADSKRIDAKLLRSTASYLIWYLPVSCHIAAKKCGEQAIFVVKFAVSFT